MVYTPFGTHLTFVIAYIQIGTHLPSTMVYALFETHITLAIWLMLLSKCISLALRVLVGTLALREVILVLFQMVSKTIFDVTYWKNKILIYSQVNRVLIIHYENILKIYLVYFKIHLEYIKNMPLFHSKLKNTFLL